MTRFLTVGLLTTAFAAVATAGFDGPAPLAWRFVQPTSVAPGGSPLVDGNTVYQSIGGRVFCIEKDTGNLKWRFPQLDPIPGAFRSSPVLAEGTLVVAGDNKILYGVNPADGELKWSYPMATPVYGQPIQVGTSIVFATSDNRLHAISAATGQPVWQNPYAVHDGITGSLAAYQNGVIFFTTRMELVSVDLTTRNTNWRQRFTQIPPNPAPVVQGDTIYSVSGPFLIATNANSGTARWQVSTGLQINMPPSVGPEAVYVVSQDGKAMGFTLDRERLTKAPIELGTQAMTRPTVSGRHLIVPTTAGGVALVDPEKGVIWNYLIRPFNETQTAQPTTGGGGAGDLGLAGGGARGGAANQNPVKVVTVQASAPGVVSGDTLLLPARDGSLLAFDKNFGVDLTPPSVKMVFPNPGDQVSGQPPLLLAFKLEDEASGINMKTVKIEIDGQAYDTVMNRDGLLLVMFSLTGKNRALSDGRKNIVVTAVDWLGNETKQAFALTIDNRLDPIRLPGSDQGAGGAGGRGGTMGLGGGLGGGLTGGG